MKNQKGFTLIEFLISLAITGISLSIIIPLYMGLQEKDGQKILINEVDKRASFFQVELKESRADNIVRQFFQRDDVIGITSPWNSDKPLWINGGNAENIGYCQIAYFDLSAYGQISVCVNPKKDEIYLYAESSQSSKFLYQKVISK